MGQRATTRAVDEVVWYVAYGSNLGQERLQRYLTRGPDPTPPRADRPLHIGHPVFFAGESQVWGGGRAYVDHAAVTPTRTPARAWLLTRGQWDDLHERESGADHTAGTDPDSLTEGEVRVVGEGRYDALIGLGRHAGVPVVTFTRPEPLDLASCTRPDPAYLRAIATGLAESHGLTPEEAAAYLASRPGMAGHWTVAEVRAALGAGSGPG
jgi:hypothetical protein